MQAAQHLAEPWRVDLAIRGARQAGVAQLLGLQHAALRIKSQTCDELLVTFDYAQQLNA